MTIHKTYYIPCVCEDCKHNWLVKMVLVLGKWDIEDIKTLNCEKCNACGSLDTNHLCSLISLE